jgi:hypothetical protein
MGDPDEERAARELAAEVLTGIRGPRHVNLGFREPLSSPQSLPDVSPGSWPPPAAPADVLELRPAPARWSSPARGREPRPRRPPGLWELRC